MRRWSRPMRQRWHGAAWSRRRPIRSPRIHSRRACDERSGNAGAAALRFRASSWAAHFSDAGYRRDHDCSRDGHRGDQCGCPALQLPLIFTPALRSDSLLPALRSDGDRNDDVGGGVNPDATAPVLANRATQPTSSGADYPCRRHGTAR